MALAWSLKWPWWHRLTTRWHWRLSNGVTLWLCSLGTHRCLWSWGADSESPSRKNFSLCFLWIFPGRAQICWCFFFGLKKIPGDFFLFHQLSSISLEIWQALELVDGVLSLLLLLWCGRALTKWVLEGPDGKVSASHKPRGRAVLVSCSKEVKCHSLSAVLGPGAGRGAFPHYFT